MKQESVTHDRRTRLAIRDRGDGRPVRSVGRALHPAFGAYGEKLAIDVEIRNIFIRCNELPRSSSIDAPISV